MKKPVVKLNPQEADGVTRRGRGTRHPDKWDKKAEQMWAIIKANFNAEHPWGVRPNSLTLIARELRRTDAAAYRRGLSTVLLKRIEAMQREPRKGAIQ